MLTTLPVESPGRTRTPQVPTANQGREMLNRLPAESTGRERTLRRQQTYGGQDMLTTLPVESPGRTRTLEVPTSTGGQDMLTTLQGDMSARQSSQRQLYPRELESLGLQDSGRLANPNSLEPPKPQLSGLQPKTFLTVDKLETLLINRPQSARREEDESSIGINDDLLVTLDKLKDTARLPKLQDPFESFAASVPEGSPSWSSISFESLPTSEAAQLQTFDKLRSALDSATDLDDQVKQAIERLLGGTSDLAALRSQQKLLEFRN